ncbi:MAG TPA: NPCBM/NEW2 domain-containing protein, partial [Tepidisphaeraceae bacterium]|nr:NPCBM/NEW2 domain-containing protein [Tepidisphaeraceae bacterium]
MHGQVARATWIWIALLALIPESTFAQDDWTLTTADFQTQPVSITSVNEKGVQFTPAGQTQVKTIAIDQFLDLDRPLAAPTPAAPMVLYLTGGDRLTGSAIAMKDEKLQWKHPILGELSIPLKRLVAIAKPTQPAPRDDEARTEDVATLANGDSVHGILSAISAESVTINSNGQDVPVPLSTINVLSLASTQAPQAAPARRGFRVTLADGSSFTGETVQSEKDNLVIGSNLSGSRGVPLSTVARIEQINGPVSWLAARVPTENVQIPYFSSQTLPAKMGLTVDGSPIRLGDRNYPHSIGAHAYSRLVFPIDPAYKTFRTQYAIDG